MAYLNKRQYEYRAYSAGKRNQENSEKAIENGMSEECADLLSSLCSIRHELHTSIDDLVKNQSECSTYDELNNILDAINDSELPHLYLDIEDIEDIYTQDYCGEFEDEEGERDDDKYDDAYNEIYSQWENVNDKIENYLRDIDKQYNTSFAPTGALRE